MKINLIDQKKNFSNNFDQQTGIKNKDLNKKFIDSLSIFVDSL